MILLIVLLLGAAWRRWWGDERPAWAYPGYRATQAVAGAVVLAMLCTWTGDPWLWALAKGIGATAFMSLPIKISLYGVTDLWQWIDERVGTPKLGRVFTGYTTYSEATQGAILWLLAVSI